VPIGQLSHLHQGVYFVALGQLILLTQYSEIIPVLSDNQTASNDLFREAVTTRKGLFLSIRLAELSLTDCKIGVAKIKT
jgi:hypothetical protein